MIDRKYTADPDLYHRRTDTSYRARAQKFSAPVTAKAPLAPRRIKPVFERFTQRVRDVVARVAETLPRLVREATVPVAVVIMIEFHVLVLALRLRLSVQQEPRHYRPLRWNTKVDRRAKGRKAPAFKRLLEEYGPITVAVILPMVVYSLQIVVEGLKLLN